MHEWKGNYGVLGAYLQDDGSLIQNAEDPDFPVFAGGGEAEEYKKLHGTVKYYGTLNMLMNNTFIIMILR